MNERKLEEPRSADLPYMTAQEGGAPPVEAADDRQTMRLIHELQVAKVELEMQNEALRSRDEAIEQARINFERLYHNYAELFNFAPIAYLTIDRDGVIDDINVTAAIMLNAPRSTLVDQRITDYIHCDDQDGFYYQKLSCQQKETIKAFEIKMKRSNGDLFDARVQMQRLSADNGEDPYYSMALMDVSENVQLSTSFALEQHCLDIAMKAGDRQSLLNAAVRMIKDFLKCDAVGIRLLDADGRIPYQAYDGFTQAFYESESPLSLHTDQCMCITVIKKTTDPSRSYFTPHGSFHLNGTSRFLATVPPADRGSTRNVCNAHGYESVALVPIPIDGSVEGLIHVAHHRENMFPLRLVEALEIVGKRLGLAIQRFRLQEWLNDSVNTLQHLSSRLLTAQEDEQRRIAMELHDGSGQELNVLKLQLKGLQRRLPNNDRDLHAVCDQLLAHADKIINDIRNMAHGLMPAALDALGLAAAAKQVIREACQNIDIQVDTDLIRLDRVRDPIAKVCLFRIIQESLTNILKHAQATWLSITADDSDETLCIRIRDNGVGFDCPSKQDGINGSDQGLGLSAMALRCRMIGATLSIESSAGGGTQLTVSLPCTPQEAKP